MKHDSFAFFLFCICLVTLFLACLYVPPAHAEDMKKPYTIQYSSRSNSSDDYVDTRNTGTIQIPSDKKPDPIFWDFEPIKDSE